MTWSVHEGDCRQVMAGMDPGSIDAIVTDPPYGLSFMGKGWDHAVPGVEFWTEALRVAKPGAHLLAFGGTRLYHRLTCAIEDAGWEVRDCLMWLYAQGFPKSHNVANSIDKANGHPPRGRAIPTASTYQASDTERKHKLTSNKVEPYKPRCNESEPWVGWGTALKPAWEPIILARKPFKGTVAANVLAHGTGAVNVDGCRVETGDDLNGGAYASSGTDRSDGWRMKRAGAGEYEQPSGRWPANVILDAEAGAMVDEQAGGNPSRFFYCPKASKADRDSGLEDAPYREKYEAKAGEWGVHNCFSGKDGDEAWKAKHPNLPKKNNHPTVKPHDLMRYLCRLVTPPGGTVLDPFCGSGSTGKAAVAEGFGFIGIEMDADYCEIARARTSDKQTA